MSQKPNDDYLSQFEEELPEEKAERESKRSHDDFAAMLNDSFKAPSKKLSVGDKISAEVLVVGKEEIFVSLGGAAAGAGGATKDGIVSRRDMLDEAGEVKCKVGDKIDLYVTQTKGGQVYLSPSKTGKNLADDLEEAFDRGMAIEGKVVEVVKGGFRVQLRGKLAFCPVSQIDSRFVENPEEYVGKKLEFNITKFEEGGRNIVVSRKKLLTEQGALMAGSFLEEHKEGDVVRGKIKRLEKFGAFIELAPGLEGLAHVSELAWSRTNDPAEVVSVGQEVAVKILKVERPAGAQDKLRLSLSIKQAGAEPWENLSSDIAVGRVVSGKVTRCMKFGAFVELSPGIEGLIPLSEMSYTKRVMRPDEFVKEGDQITVMVKEIHPDTKRISLSLKDAGQDPWALVAQKYPVGTILKGKVTRREGYGLFVELEEGVTGLLPKTKALEGTDFPFDKLKINDEATVQVAEIRREERRISLKPPGDASEGDWKAYQATQNAAAASSGGGLGSFGGALGDKLKAAMASKGAAGGGKNK